MISRYLDLDCPHCGGPLGQMARPMSHDGILTVESVCQTCQHRCLINLGELRDTASPGLIQYLATRGIMPNSIVDIEHFQTKP